MKNSENNLPVVENVVSYTDEVDMDIVYAEQVKNLYKFIPTAIVATSWMYEYHDLWAHNGCRPL